MSPKPFLAILLAIVVWAAAPLRPVEAAAIAVTTTVDELNTDEKTDTSKLTELQKVDLDKLKLVAVVVGTATPMAMVEDPAGKGHTLKIGTLVGKRLGQVKHIRRGEVVVQEEFRDFTGKRIPQLKELKLDVDNARP